MAREFQITLALVLLCSSCAVLRKEAAPREPTLVMQNSGTGALLIGLHPVSDRVVWASGTGGTFLRTLDGGATWETGVVPGADTLQFRDVHAFGADVAYLLSIGTGEASRIYKTIDGGRSWELQFLNEEPDAFYDCFDFWNERTGIAFSDGVDGRFPMVRTSDGTTWKPAPHTERPTALPDEGGFASSGTCLRVLDRQTVFIGTGNGPTARVLRSEDGGKSWQAFATPIESGPAIGITTLSFRDPLRGVALGGDLSKPDLRSDNVAVTRDGGRTWTLAGRPSFPGAVYGSSYLPDSRTIVAVGPRGASYSPDDGENWMPLDTLSYWSVAFASPRTGWAVGPEGRIARIVF